MSNFNNYTNESEVGLQFARPSMVRQLVATMYGTIFIVGFTSNLLTLSLILCVRSLRTVSTIPIFNLCLAGFIDILVLPFIMTFNIMHAWPFGNAACKLVLTSETVSKHATICFAALASVERYFGVCKADIWRHSWTSRLAGSLVVGLWMVSIIFTIPIYLYSGTFRREEIHSSVPLQGQRCSILMPQPATATEIGFDVQYAVSTFVILYAIPTIVILLSYLNICAKLSSISRRLQNHAQSNGTHHRNSFYASTHRHKRVTKTILVIVAFFLFCWSPYWFLNIFKIFVKHRTTSTFITVVLNVVHMLPFINCAINPLLYGLLSGNFRSAITDLWRRKYEVCCCFPRRFHERSTQMTPMISSSLAKKKTTIDTGTPLLAVLDASNNNISSRHVSVQLHHLGDNASSSLQQHQPPSCIIKPDLSSHEMSDTIISKNCDV